MTYPKKNYKTDYNFTGDLNSLGRKMEHADTKNGWGKRSVLLSQCHYMQEGFNLNKRIVFDTVLRQSLECVIDRESNTVQLSIPAIHTAINFVNQGKNPLYRFVLMAGFVSDLIITKNLKSTCPPRMQYRLQFLPLRIGYR